MKVYGGMIFLKGRQVRTIVATKTKKKARELVDVGVSEFNNYWSETRNEIELDIALAKPNTVFVASHSMGNDFKSKEKETQ